MGNAADPVRPRFNKAQYSLDCENGIENAVLLKPQTPEMLLEEKQFQE